MARERAEGSARSGELMSCGAVSELLFLVFRLASVRHNTRKASRGGEKIRHIYTYPSYRTCPTPRPDKSKSFRFGHSVSRICGFIIG